MRLIVNTTQFRQALAACLPHSAGPKAGVMEALRVQVTPERLWVMATSGGTSCMAVATIYEEAEGLTGDPSEDAFHLSPANAKAILAVFTQADELDETQLDIIRTQTDNGHELKIRDVGGLLEGSELTLTGCEPDATFPNVAGAVMPATLGDTPLPVWTDIDGSALARFVRTAKAYGGGLTITQNTRTGSSYHIAVGALCRGLITIKRYDDDGDAPDFAAFDQQWEDQTGALADAMRRAQLDRWNHTTSENTP